MLCGALRRAVDSQLAYVKKPTVAGRAEAAKAHRWLWVLPTLLLRVPPSGETADENAKVASARKRESLVTDRVKLMEADHAIDLLETYVAELENPITNLNRNMMPAWTDVQQINYGSGQYGRLLMVASNRPKLPLSQDPRSREMSQRCWSCAVWLLLMWMMPRDVRRRLPRCVPVPFMQHAGH